MCLPVFLILVLHTGNILTNMITSHDLQKPVLEGKNVTLTCNYSGVPDNLHWYRQYPRSTPKFLLYIYESGLMSDNIPQRLTPRINKNTKRVDLEISSAAVTDSAVYYCALRPTVTGNKATLAVMMFLCILILLSIIQDECFAQTIKPLQDRTQVTEGKPVNLSCKYDVSAQSLLWYRQYPGSGLEFLLLVVESSKKTVVHADPPIPRLDGEMSMKDKRVDLMISSAEVTDSALYYCALVPTVRENTTPLYKNLQPCSMCNTQMVLKLNHYVK
ncbi:uncharacterized protein LOC131530106 isoform X2 [Onychostoma macrolepis]|uniref:uncharacterized protein LOC131530106 isoform X2 n=1 Tax=Onychostoma macrolepis TaxID=369639 RepID=UPI00272D0C1F|nr:uncharacterized protein LOC131530106 isoform X2 [Onychostoma macrolepis]